MQYTNDDDLHLSLNQHFLVLIDRVKANSIIIIIIIIILLSIIIIIIIIIIKGY